jgi:hypothetical protein
MRVHARLGATGGRAAVATLARALGCALGLLGAQATALPAQEVTANRFLTGPLRVSCSTQPVNERTGSGPVARAHPAVCTCLERDHDSDPRCVTPADELTRLLDSGTTATLRQYLELLATFAGSRPGAPPWLMNKKHLRFVWVQQKADGSAVARQVIYSAGEDPTAVPTLPGIRADGTSDSDMVDILVDFDPDPGMATPYRTLLASRYSSERKDNPLLEQVPALIKQLGVVEFLGVGAGAVKPAATETAAVPPPPPPPQPGEALFTVWAPTLPAARADVGISDLVLRGVPLAEIREAASGLAARLAASEGRQSTCAAQLSSAYEAAIGEEIPDSAAQRASASRTCSALVNGLAVDPDGCREVLADALGRAYRQVIPSCTPDTGAVGHDPVAAVRSAFSDLVSTLGYEAAEGEGSFHNTPRDQVSFGVMTALRLGSPHFSGDRAKVGDDGVVQVDPLPRLISSVIVNWHPFGSDPSKVVTYKDKGSVRLFGGTAITPDFGLVAGASYSPIKGLAVSVGRAWLFINTPRAGVSVGSPLPEDPAIARNPFERGTASTWFWGLTYSLQ